VELASGGALIFRPTWLAPEEATRAFEVLRDGVPWVQKTIRIAGREVLEPRLTAWYGDPDAAYTYSGARLEPLAWTPLLSELRARIEEAASSAFNSVLLNYYRSGEDAMGFHADKEKELGTNPLIASLSLGAPRRFVLKYRKKNAGVDPIELELTHGSLLIMAGTTQHFWRHGVPKAKSAEPRINLTFRRIIAA
jgi:alkylated DNA repair dioxygenase AlkB